MADFRNFNINDVDASIVIEASSISVSSIDGLSSTSVQDTIEELKENTDTTLDLQEDNIRDLNIKTNGLIGYDDTSFAITDSRGNTVCKVNEAGLHDISRVPLIDNVFYITDSSGFVITKINKYGIQSIKYLDEDGVDLKTYIDSASNSYTEYELFTIGDSLSAGNVWNVTCAQYLGCTFNASANIKSGCQISTGGTTTYGGSKTSGFFRTKYLVDQALIDNDGENAIIVLENVNDQHGVTILDDGNWEVSGTKEDAPIYPTDPINDYITSSEFTSEYLSSIIDKFAVGAFCSVYTVTSGKLLTIDTLPTTEGYITIKTGQAGSGILTYSIHVVPQSTDEETLAYVVERILECNYTGVTDTPGDSSTEIAFTTGNSTYPASLSFDGGTTGMTATVTDTSTAKVDSTKIFLGETEEDWVDTTKWENASSYMNMWRSWKSSIEYLISNYPKAHIFIMTFPLHNALPSNYQRTDGTYDYVLYNNSSLQLKCAALSEFHQQLADIYNIVHLNTHYECGINLGNYSTYYYDNNVHPKTAGYNKIGKFVAKQIIQNIY